MVGVFMAALQVGRDRQNQIGGESLERCKTGEGRWSSAPCVEQHLHGEAVNNHFDFTNNDLYTKIVFTKV